MENLITTIIQDYTIIPVFVICICVGYCIKHITALDKIANQLIPTIVCILGVILACWMNNEFSVMSIAQGMASGLASTGFHQLVGQLIEHYANQGAKVVTVWEDEEGGEEDGE